ncbi:hypothetical protein [Pelomonas sp. KK5]|uniref:hypothetical protein n=1 Tax=Pelomonas sp. KK5 TaxID=1855730 RepID=UPI00097C4A88|nr:hypothetical protein [Pelomonas sp. KK5]
MKTPTDDEYTHLHRYLEYTLHELPAGVLYGHNSANEQECAELMEATYQLERLATERGVDLSEFLGACRWHYERYPHYLGRQRHFGNYANYMAKHDAPAKIRA